jgi:hypothetical protein
MYLHCGVIPLNIPLLKRLKQHGTERENASIQIQKASQQEMMLRPRHRFHLFTFRGKPGRWY